MKRPAFLLHRSDDPRPVVADGFQPRRDDDVAKWLRRFRDFHPGHSERHYVVDGLLARYNECADYGLTLRPEDDELGDP